MGLVEIGVGHRMVSWFFWVLPFRWVFFFFNMGFCSGGQWWRGGHGGGAMVVTGQWRCSDRG